MLYLRSFNRFILVSLALLGLSISSVNAAVVWDWDGSNLLGAQNVDVNGTLYDVAFVEGDCITLFDGCNEASDFTFSSSAEGLAASQSLLDQVFLDANDVGQMFDSVPSLTNGCTNLTICNVFTPYGFELVFAGLFDWSAAVNDIIEIADVAVTGGLALPTQDSSGLAGTGVVYAKWSSASTVPAVPVPAAVWLFGTALIGFVGMSRRRKVA